MQTAWQDADRAALDRWLALHTLARKLPAGADSTLLAEAALKHVVPLAAELPPDPPFVGVHHPTKPSAATIEPWLERVEAAAGTPESGTLVASGVELGLLGVDANVDRRAAKVIVDGFELETVQQAMEEIGRQALLDPLVGKIAAALAHRVAEDVTLRPRLRELCRNDAALLSLKDEATAHPSLAVMSVYLWAVVDRHPERRPSAARTLLMLDANAGADVRALWGDEGPRTTEEHAELLRTYADAERRPPDLDINRALDRLMADSLDEVDKGDPLALALRALSDHLELPAYCAWYAAARQPGPTHPLDAWARFAARALAARPGELPEERKTEILKRAIAELISPATLDGYFTALEGLRDAAGHDEFDAALTEALQQALTGADDPSELLAATFSIWAKAPNGGHDLHDRVLAPAARPYRRHDDEIRAHLGPRRQAEWDEWAERNARPRFARVRGRLFARRRG